MTDNLKVTLVADDGALARFRELLLEYEASLPAHLQHSDLNSELADFERSYASPDNAAWIATIDGAPCGCIALRALDRRTGIVRKLYVKPQHRRRGAARALFDALAAAARQRGYTRLVLDTERDALRPAYDLYRSLGFKDCPPYGDVDYPNPTYMELMLI